MSERPILMSAPMVCAVLDGSKSQTRRVARKDGYRFGKCQYGAVGDTLWVRETWAHYQTINSIRRHDGASSSEVSDGLAGYRADGFDTIEAFREHVRAMCGLDLQGVEINGNRWRPSIHMPRWASRITLKITGVRVEQLQDISADDAAAEGWPGPDADNSILSSYPIGWYAHLWDKINARRAPWSSNPWVWVIGFQVVAAKQSVE